MSNANRSFPFSNLRAGMPSGSELDTLQVAEIPLVREMLAKLESQLVAVEAETAKALDIFQGEVASGLAEVSWEVTKANPNPKASPWMADATQEEGIIVRHLYWGVPFNEHIRVLWERQEPCFMSWMKDRGWEAYEASLHRKVLEKVIAAAVAFTTTDFGGESISAWAASGEVPDFDRLGRRATKRSPVKMAVQFSVLITRHYGDIPIKQVPRRQRKLVLQARAWQEQGLI